MIYAVRDTNGETHLVGSLDGYEDWTVVDQLDQDVEGPIGLVGDKIVSLSYLEDRRTAYPSLADQLDMIYHDMDGWRAAIKAVKDKYPKPG